MTFQEAKKIIDIMIHYSFVHYIEPDINKERTIVTLGNLKSWIEVYKINGIQWFENL